MMSSAPDFTETTAVDVFVEMSGIPTEKLLANCLYTIDDPREIAGIVAKLNAARLDRATQRKAANWLIFRFPRRASLRTDLDEEAAELRVTTDDWIREYRISEEACRHLRHHIQEARSLYEGAYSIKEAPQHG